MLSEDEGKVAIGRRVEAVYLDGEDGFTLPQFKLSNEPPRDQVWRYPAGRGLYLLWGGSGLDVSVKSLGIDRLSLADRILLVEEIWDSIAAEAKGLGIPGPFDRRQAGQRLGGHHQRPPGQRFSRIRHLLPRDRKRAVQEL